MRKLAITATALAGLTGLYFGSDYMLKRHYQAKLLDNLSVDCRVALAQFEASNRDYVEALESKGLVHVPTACEEEWDEAVQNAGLREEAP
jgi:hypothetical protein